MDDGRPIVVADHLGTDPHGPRPASPRAAGSHLVTVDTDPVAAQRTSGRVPGNPWLAVPGMVLLAAASIFAGYYWLQIIPDGSLRPSGLFLAVVVVPVTFGLTRHRSQGRASTFRRLTRLSAAAMPVLALVALTTRASGWTRCLGVTSLVLAASILTLAVMSERSEHPWP